MDRAAFPDGASARDRSPSPRAGLRRRATSIPAIAPLALLLCALVLPGAGARAQACGSQVDDAAPTACRADAAGEPDAVTGGVRPVVAVGNPLSLVTGNKHQREPDLRLPGSPLGFVRHYNSTNTDFDIGLGRGWHHTFSARLTRVGEREMDIVQSDGRRLRFTLGGSDGDGRRRYRGVQASDGTLSETSDGEHLWRTVDGRRIAFRGSFLVRVAYPDGHRLSLHYRQRRLTHVSDEQGRRIRFEYHAGRAGADLGRYVEGDGEGGGEAGFVEPPGHLARLILPDGRVVRYDYDHAFNLVRVRHPDGSVRRYHYESDVWPNHLTGITERTGVRSSSWAYDDHGRTILSERAGGVERVTLSYELADAVPADATPPDTASDTADAFGTTRITDSLGRTSLYRWRRSARSGASLLLSSEGPGCATCPPTGWRYAYTADDRLTSATAPNGDRQRFVHDERGRLVEAFVRSAGGTERRVVRYAYEADSLLPDRIARPSVAPGAEHVTLVARGPSGEVLSVEERGFRPVPSTLPDDVAAVHDPRRDGDRVSAAPVDDPGDRSLEEPADTRGARGHDGSGSSNGTIGTNEANATDGALARVTPPGAFDERALAYRPITRRVTFSHTGGRLVAIDGPRTDVEDITRFRHDERGRVVAIVFPDGRTLSIDAFDALGRPVTFRLGSRSPMRLTYTDRGDVARVEHLGRAVRYAHDAEGRLLRATDADGRTRELVRDEAGRVVRVVDDAGRVERIDRDTENRVRARTFSGIDGDVFRVLGYVRDAEERLGSVASGETRDAAPSAGDPAHAGSEASGLLGLADGVRAATRMTGLDANGRLARLATPSGGSVTLEHDARGRPLALTDARGNRTVRLRDDFGRVVLEHGPDTGLRLDRFDEADNRVSSVRADGSVFHYAWDAANRLLRERGVDDDVRFAYDPASARLARVTNRHASESFEYDAEHRLARHVRRLGGHAFSTAYAYDEAGRLDLKTLPDGTRLRHHYHADGPNRGTLRAVVRERLFGLRKETLLAEIDLDGRDGTSGHLAGNGRRTRREHAPDGRVTALEVSETLRLGYRFDENGRIALVEENGERSRYAHERGRLVLAETPTATYRYAHDALGNRTAREIASADGTRERHAYTYAPPGRGNRLIGVEDTLRGTATVPVTDVLGRTVDTGDGRRHTHDAKGRPTRLHRNGRLVAEYAYNAFGERVSKTVHAPDGSSRTRHFLYDGRALVAEATGNGTIVAQYLYLGEHVPVVKLEPRRTLAIHADHLGTPRLMTNEDGAVAWQARYTPFGEATVLVEKARLDLRLPGQYADAESGTHYNYFRTYDPALGRYTTSDPIGLDGGLNTYAYVGGDPLGAIDPLGLQAKAVPMLTIGAGASAGLLAWLGQAAVTTVATVTGAAVVATAGVAIVGAAAILVQLYFDAVESNAYEAELGGKPGIAENRALLDQAASFGIELTAAQSAGYLNGSWDSYLALAALVEREQREYVERYRQTLDAFPESCPAGFDQELLRQAQDAIDLADEARRRLLGVEPEPVVLANPIVPDDGSTGVFAGSPMTDTGTEPTTFPEDRPDGPTPVPGFAEVENKPGTTPLPAEQPSTPTILNNENSELDEANGTDPLSPAPIDVPGRVQSRINIRTGEDKGDSGWLHVVHRHFHGTQNASQFTISESELRSLIQSKDAVSAPIIGYVDSNDGIRYVREIELDYHVGTNKHDDWKPTSTLTIMTDTFGNLVTAYPGTDSGITKL